MATATNRPLAVITGASSGIGFELAKQCVEHGFDAIICAEDSSIDEAAARLRTAGTVVETVRADLATYDGNEELVRRILSEGRPVDALLLNAGIGVNGAFHRDEPRAGAEDARPQLRVGDPPREAARGADGVARPGRVLITASIASTAPAPFLAVYGATKAFDLSFAEALREELKDSGVTVTALQPGATETEFFERAHMEDTRVGQAEKDDPADVAKQGFEAMMKGKDSVIAASIKTKLQGLANELLPETTKAKAQAQDEQAGLGHEVVAAALRTAAASVSFAPCRGWRTKGTITQRLRRSTWTMPSCSIARAVTTAASITRATSWSVRSRRCFVRARLEPTHGPVRSEEARRCAHSPH